MVDSYNESIQSSEWIEKYLKIIRTRRVRDSRGTWHTLTQSAYTFFLVGELIGICNRPDAQFYHAEINRSRNIDIEIMDTALAESERGGASLDLCFQNHVLERSREAMHAEAVANLAKNPGDLK
jgi:hypothetical protein